LAFGTQPAPTSIPSGQSTSFTTVPVVRAVDANNTVDTDYTTAIVLSVTDPVDSTVDGTVNGLSVTAGDTDGSAATVTLTPASGVATFTGLALNYTNNASASNTLALHASSVGLTAANSSNITSTSNAIPTITELNGDSSSFSAGASEYIDVQNGSGLDVVDTDSANFNGGYVSITRSSGTADGSFLSDYDGVNNDTVKFGTSEVAADATLAGGDVVYVRNLGNGSYVARGRSAH